MPRWRPDRPTAGAPLSGLFYMSMDTALGPVDFSGPRFLVAPSLGIRHHAFALTKLCAEKSEPGPGHHLLIPYIIYRKVFCPVFVRVFAI